VTLGSLFDGSGTAPLAARMCGIEPIWCSEIEPFPIAVTRARFPDMKHYGNICTIKGDKIEPVDIICGGSPCQDLSVAGKRAGLEGGERSVLFHEQIRIIKEMRHATNDIRPRFAIWENVPGAFSSNKGEDFRCVLEAFCKIADETADIPRPAEGKWAAAGCIVGNGWSVAYRTLDAQYFGVPQRRRRIFLVADFGSECAAEILSFEGGLFGDIAESGETRESAAGKIEGGVGESVGIDGYNSAVTGKVVSTLGVNCGMSTGRQSVIEPQYFENHGQDERYTGPHDIASCVTAGYGMGGSTKPFIVSPDPIKVLPFNERQITSPQNGNNPDYGDPCHTLSATDGAPTVCIKQETYQKTTGPLMANSHPGSYSGQDAYSDMFVTQPIGFDRYNGDITGEVAQTLAGVTRDNNVPHVLYENHQFGGYREGCGTLKAAGGDYGGGSENIAVCGDNTEQEKLNARTFRNEALRVLQQDYAAEEILQWGIASLDILQQAEVLRFSLYGEGVPLEREERKQLHNISLPRPEVVAGWLLRDMREQSERGCASQGRGLHEQQSAEFAAAVPSMSYASASSARDLLDMWEKGERLWLLREALSEIQEIRKSADVKSRSVCTRDIVRRLTPVECARLMGFPPTWCSDISIPNPTESDISFWQSVWDTYQIINGKKPKPVKQIISWLKHPHSDSAEYKMWGNGMALPCVLYIMRGIISAERPIT
jgi:site-specific DNA-cytosine methylase